MHQTDNDHDSNAIQGLSQSGDCFGFINRLQCSQILEWQNNGSVSSEVFRFNGRPVYPRLFIMAEIDPGRMAKAA